MRFGLTVEQQELRDAVRDMLVDSCPPSVVRAAYEQGEPGAVWRRLVNLGLPVALVPAASGGLGLTEVDLVGCFETTGEAAVPGPVVETAAVGAPLLAATGETGALSQVGAGEVLVTAALDGTYLLPYPDAELAIVAAGSSLWWADLPDVSVTPVATVDRARPVGRVDPADGGWVLLTDDPALASAAWRRGVTATAAQLLGLAVRMLTMTVEYVRTREQFGVPVGSFQAVKHRLADALLSLEMARPVVYAAAWAHAVGADHADRDVAAAKAAASDAANTVAGAALQCHGAIGYTEEHDLHLWIKRTWALTASWGTAAAHRSRLAAQLGL